jgi:hypothetical protein
VGHNVTNDSHVLLQSIDRSIRCRATRYPCTVRYVYLIRVVHYITLHYITLHYYHITNNNDDAGLPKAATANNSTCCTVVEPMLVLLTAEEFVGINGTKQVTIDSFYGWHPPLSAYFNHSLQYLLISDLRSPRDLT